MSSLALATVCGVPGWELLRRQRSAAWVVVLAVMVGLGLVAMHSEPSPSAHAHGGGAGHQEQASSVLSAEGEHAPTCKGCGSHASMRMVCAVLLVAAAGAAAIRLLRRLAVHARWMRAPILPLRAGWLRMTYARARAPDLHWLQVMRC